MSTIWSFDHLENLETEILEIILYIVKKIVHKKYN